MYKDFSAWTLNEDAQYKKLLDTSLALMGHGVHTYEHLRAVAASYYASGNDSLNLVLKNFLYKINKCTLPSGAPAGDEFIGGRLADATNTGYEYCSVHELMEGYISLLAKTGNAFYGDKTERLFLNAAQGARHPSQSSICYLKTDNAWYLTGGKNGDTSDIHQTRYRYSPVHKEAAVCCVPNAGRIGPAYIQSMWMKETDALVATILGPCELTTTLYGETISIDEQTNYPFGNSFAFQIKTSHPVKFTLKIRKPSWAAKAHVSATYTTEDDFIVITQQWNNNNIKISFDATATMIHTLNDEIYFMYGSLVLAHPVDFVEKITKRYAVADLKALQYIPVDSVVFQYNHKTAPEKSNNQLFFHAYFVNPQTGKEEVIELVPMGKTILRQVTFKMHDKQ